MHDKKDSTGICFIGERPFREFLSTYIPANPGKICDTDGVELGEHTGLMYYTLGQRQGLGIGGRQDAGDLPWYVVDKDLANNVLVVDQGDTTRLLSRSLTASQLSWIGDEPQNVRDGIRLAAKVRYRQADQACVATQLDDQTIRVDFDEPQRAGAPGQYVVFYEALKRHQVIYI